MTSLAWRASPSDGMREVSARVSGGPGAPRSSTPSGDRGSRPFDPAKGLGKRKEAAERARTLGVPSCASEPSPETPSHGSPRALNARRPAAPRPQRCGRPRLTRLCNAGGSALHPLLAIFAEPLAERLPPGRPPRPPLRLAGSRSGRTALPLPGGPHARTPTPPRPRESAVGRASRRPRSAGHPHRSRPRDRR